MADAIRVLHIDDDPDFLDLAATFMEQVADDISVVTATSGTAGLDRLGDDVDCVVSDYDMPGMDGLAFLDAVREEAPEMPFVLFTGKGSEEVASQAIARGVTFYQQKETGTEQYELLANNVRRAVQERRAVARASRHRQDRRQYERAVESSEDMIAAVTADRTYLFANGTFLEYHGLEREQVVGAHVAEVLDEAAYEVVEPKLDRVLDGETVQYEMTNTYDERGERHFDIRYYPLRDEADEVEGAVAEMRDITDRKERQRRLELFESIVQHSDDGVYVFDADAQFAFVNDRVVEVSGIEAEHWIGQPVSILADLGTISEVEAAVIAEGVASIHRGDSDEVRVELEPDLPTDITDLELRLTPLALEDESLVLGLSRDISTVKARELELETQHARLRTIVENVPVVLYTVDRDGVFTLSEGRGLDALGLEPGEVVGESVFDVFGDHPGITENVRRALAGEEVTATVDIGDLTFRSWYQPVRTDGEVDQVIGVSMDVTDRKASARALERQNERLEEFAGIVSHDLRNPLNVAKGHLELARETCADDSLAKVAGAHDRMEELIETLLVVARQGQPVESSEPVDLGALAERAWNTVTIEAGTLRVDTEAMVEADESRLAQLLENLFRNAVEHGGPNVTVTVGDLEDGTGFFVEDTGPGIPPDDRASVIEPGYSATEDGLGFGLHIVAEIAAAHGWELAVTAGADGGARFELSGV